MTTDPAQPYRPALSEAFRSPVFWLLLAGVLATKLTALFNFARWADSDECVVGIMAKHILEQGVHPLYFYGQYYGGGASIEAHTAVLFYWLFGISSWSLKLAGVVYTAAGAVLVYGLAVRLAGVRAGRLALVTYGAMPALILWGLKTRGGYVPALVLIPGILWLADRMLRRDRLDHLGAVLAIALAAVAYWNMQSSLPLALLVAVFLLGYSLWRRRFALLAGYAAYLLAGIAGFAWWRSRSPSRVLATLTDSSGQPFFDRLFDRLGVLITQTAPDLFQPYINDTVEGANWPAPVTLVLFLAAMGLLVWRVVQDRRTATANPTVILLVLYVPVHFLSCVLAPPTVPPAPRYLFPLVPAIALIGGLAMAGVSRWIWASVTAYLVAAFVFFNAALMLKPRLYEHGVFYDPTDIQRLIRALDEADVRFVRTTYIIEWRLLFETRERIIAVNLRQPIRFPAYMQRLQQAVTRQGAPLAYVFRKDGRWSTYFLGLSPDQFAERHLRANGIRYRIVDADPYVLFITRPTATAGSPH